MARDTNLVGKLRVPISLSHSLTGWDWIGSPDFYAELSLHSLADGRFFLALDQMLPHFSQNFEFGMISDISF